MVKIAIADPPEITEHHLAEVAAYITKAKRAIVVTGAGISCNSGIPVSSCYYNLSAYSFRNRPSGFLLN